MYTYERSPYAPNRLQAYGLGALTVGTTSTKPSFIKSMGYWGSKVLRMVVKGYNNVRPGGTGWVWFPTETAALTYAMGALPPSDTPPSGVKPPVVVQPPVGTKPPVVLPPPPDVNDTVTPRYRIEGVVAYPLNDPARQRPPDQPLDSKPSYQWTRRVGDGAWLWKYVPAPDAVYIEPAVVLKPEGGAAVQADPIIKWYNSATGEIRESRLSTAPDNSGSWVRGSTAVAQGLISAGALYGISAAGGGSANIVSGATGGGGVVLPANGGGVVEAGVGAGVPTWIWIAAGAAALLFFMRKRS